MAKVQACFTRVYETYRCAGPNYEHGHLLKNIEKRKAETKWFLIFKTPIIEG